MKEDFRKRKELEEGRKAGVIPAEKDEEGRDINPHIPQYIAKAPWYVDDGAPSLKHQRTRKHDEDSTADINTHQVRISVQPAVNKYRPGACENCGSMSHKRRDCLERPRKIGAKWNAKDVAPDEYVQPVELGFDGKRDRWAGYDAEEYEEVVQAFEKVEEERVKLRAAEMERKIEAESDLKEETPLAPKIKAASLRLREDTAKYLRNLDPDSAYYDPKTRSMRDNPHPEASDPSLLPFAGDNFVRLSGDALKVPQMQLFAWQTAERGVDVSLQANPSLVEKMHREHVKELDEEAKRRQDILMSAYSSKEIPAADEQSDDSLDPLIETL